MALALDHHALKDLGAAAGALYHLEVNAQSIAGVKRWYAAQLGALKAVDHGAHGIGSASHPCDGALPRGRGSGRAGAHASGPILAAAYGSEPPAASDPPEIGRASRKKTLYNS